MDFSKNPYSALMDILWADKIHVGGQVDAKLPSRFGVFILLWQLEESRGLAHLKRCRISNEKLLDFMDWLIEEVPGPFSFTSMAKAVERQEPTDQDIYEEKLFRTLYQLDILLKDPLSKKIRTPFELEKVLPSADVICKSLELQGVRLILSLRFYQMVAESGLATLPKTRETAMEYLGDEWKAFKVVIVAECDRRFGSRSSQFTTDILNTRYVMKSFNRKRPESVAGLAKFIQRVARTQLVEG
jgi:hypothetical protein